MDSEEQKQMQDPKETLQKIQEGDLYLKNIIENGLLLLGDTKVGKTTCSHFLLGHYLVGKQNDINNVVWFLDNCEQKYRNAKIGTKESDSQTQIPNLFDVSFLETKTTLIDCPGYGDSNGCSFKISNGYFHYKIFSLVKNLKFLFVIEFGDIGGKADKLKYAFNSMINGFSQYDQIEDLFLKATCLLVTKVPKNMTKHVISERISKLKNPYKAEKLALQFKKFRDEMLGSEKLFIIQKPELDETIQGDKNILKQIDKKSTPWVRPLIDERPDMNHIKTSIKDDLKSPKSQDQGEQIQDYLQSLNKFINEEFYEKIKVLEEGFQTLISEVFNDLNETKFIQKLRELYSDDFFNKNELLKKKRAEVKASLFQSTIGRSENTKPFWLKKIRLAENLQKKSKTISEDIYSTTSLTSLKQSTLEILKSMISLVSNKDDKKFLIDFSYEVIKILDISTTFYHMMTESQPSADYLNMVGFLITQFPSLMQNLFKGLFSEPLLKKKIEFIQKFDANSYNGNAQQAEEVILFLQNICNQIENEDNQNILIDSGFDIHKILQSIKSVKKKNIEQEINSAYLSIKKINQVNPDINQVQKVRVLLKDILLRIETNLLEAQDDQSSKQRLMFFKARAMSLIGKTYELGSMTVQADRLYDGFADLYKIKQLFEKEESKKLKAFERGQISNKQFIIFYIEYCKKLIRYKDLNDARKAGYKAYHFAIQHGQIDLHSQICMLMDKLTAMETSSIDFYGETRFVGSMSFDLSKPINEQLTKFIKRIQ